MANNTAVGYLKSCTVRLGPSNEGQNVKTYSVALPDDFRKSDVLTDVKVFGDAKYPDTFSAKLLNINGTNFNIEVQRTDTDGWWGQSPQCSFTVQDAGGIQNEVEYLKSCTVRLGPSNKGQNVKTYSVALPDDFRKGDVLTDVQVFGDTKYPDTFSAKLLNIDGTNFNIGVQRTDTDGWWGQSPQCSFTVQDAGGKQNEVDYLKSYTIRLGPSDKGQNVKTYSVALPKDLPKSYALTDVKVFGDPGHPDTFSTKLLDIDCTNFNIRVQRTDTNGYWGQSPQCSYTVQAGTPENPL